MSGLLTAVYIQFPAVLPVAELSSAGPLRESPRNLMLRHCSLHKTWFTHYSLSTCSSLCYVCSADHCLYKEVPLLQGRQCTQDLRSIPPVTCERHCQRGSHIQCKHSGINLHRTWIPVTSQCLDDFPGLAVIEHVHDIAVPEGMWCDRNRKVYPVCFSQLRMVSSVTAHNGSRRRGRVVIIQLSICLT